LISKEIITKTLLISLPTLTGGSILLAGYFYKPQPIDLSRDEYLNAIKSTKVWTEKDTQELLDKLEEFNKDLCKTYQLLYAIVPTEQAIQQAKTIDQIPQLQLYRQLTSELEKKEWGILPVIIAVDSAYTYPLFVEAPDPTSTVSMKIRSAETEEWLSGLLWNMRVYTQILPKCEKYYSDEIIRSFKISAEPPPEHKQDSNNNQNNQQQQNTSTNNNNSNNINNNNNTSSNNNANNSNTNQNQNNTKNTQTTVRETVAKQTTKNKDNFDEEFKKRQEEFEKERREFEKKFNEEWKKFDEEFNKQQQQHN
jgi:hypothetical protein